MSTVLPSPHADHADWDEYANLLSAAHQAHLPEIRSLIQQLPLADVRRVLDVPCGDGFYSELLADQLAPGSEVIAVDLEEAALEAVKKRALRRPGGATIKCQSADVHAMPFPDEHFDFAWCAQSLISLSEPQESSTGPGVRNALCEMSRVLRPGGKITLLEQDAMHYVLLPWPPELELALMESQRRGFARKHGHPEQMHVGRQLGRILAEAGFQPLRRIILTANRQGIPTGELRTFLRAYFAELRDRVRLDLSQEELRQFDRHTDPALKSSFFHDPHFEMSTLEFVFLGMRP